MRRGKGVSKQATSGNGNDEEHEVTEPATPSNPYESSIKQVATVHTVEEFWSVYDFLVRPNDLPTTTDYHFFRKGIKPTWEDSANAHGGKWIVRLKKGLASRYWEEVILALIGCQFTGIPANEVCGAVVSIRYSEDIVSVWNRTNDREITDRLRDGIKRVLQLPSFVHMEYKPHETSLQDKSSFRNTQVWKPKNRGERDVAHTHTAHTHTEPPARRSGSWTDREEVREKKESWADREEVRGKKGGSSNERSWR
jgi:translation initiation factor 4E